MTDYYKILNDVVNDNNTYFRGAVTLNCFRKNEYFYVEIEYDNRTMFSEKAEVIDDDDVSRNMLSMFMLGRLFRYALMSANDDINAK